MKTMKIRLLNKQVLIFIVFIFVSAGFWLLNVSDDNAHIELEYSFELTNVPENVVITSDIPDTVKITVDDKVFEGMRYRLRGKQNYSLQLDFTEMVGKATKNMNGGSFVIDRHVWEQLLNRKLFSSSHVIAYEPSFVEVTYASNVGRRLPVVFNGKAVTTADRELMGIRLDPDSVLVYAASSILDTLTRVYTEHVQLENVQQPVEEYVSVLAQRGVKTRPEEVKMSVSVDWLISKKVSVPITVENLPMNKILRTFPMKADISFLITASTSGIVSPSDFQVVVDYLDIDPSAPTCRVKLRKAPAGISNVRLSVETVEYVLEDN